MRVAAEDEEKARWAKILEGMQREFAEVGIVYKNEVWYFGEAKGRSCWPDI